MKTISSTLNFVILLLAGLSKVAILCKLLKYLSAFFARHNLVEAAREDKIASEFCSNSPILAAKKLKVFLTWRIVGTLSDYI